MQLNCIFENSGEDLMAHTTTKLYASAFNSKNKAVTAIFSELPIINCFIILQYGSCLILYSEPGHTA